MKSRNRACTVSHAKYRELGNVPFPHQCGRDLQFIRGGRNTRWYVPRGRLGCRVTMYLGLRGSSAPVDTARSVRAQSQERDHTSSTMQRRNEHDIVVWLELIRVQPFELPIRIIDQNQDPRSAALSSAKRHHQESGGRTQSRPARTCLSSGPA